MKHAHAFNYNREGGRNLCYKPSQQNQVNKHQCKEMENNLRRYVISIPCAFELAFSVRSVRIATSPNNKTVESRVFFAVSAEAI
jgi:hypothetical protein